MNDGMDSNFGVGSDRPWPFAVGVDLSLDVAVVPGTLDVVKLGRAVELVRKSPAGVCVPVGILVIGTNAADIDPGVGKSGPGVLLGSRIPVDAVAVRHGGMDSASDVAAGAWKAPAPEPISASTRWITV